MTKDTTKPEKQNGIVIKENSQHNEFELSLRFLGNELIAIKLAATNFSAKLIVWSILLLIFSLFGLINDFQFLSINAFSIFIPFFFLVA